MSPDHKNIVNLLIISLVEAPALSIIIYRTLNFLRELWKSSGEKLEVIHSWLIFVMSKQQESPSPNIRTLKNIVRSFKKPNPSKS